MVLPRTKKAFIGSLLIILLIVVSGVLFLFLRGGVSPLMAVKAFRAGYGLVHQGNYFDMVGRTVMADKSRYTPSLFDDLGGGANRVNEPPWWENSNGLANRIYGAGIFKKWEEIGGEKDRYLFLTDPYGAGEIKFRLIFEPKAEFFGRFHSVICIDDLDFGSQELEALGSGGKPVFMPLGYLSDFSPEEIERIFQPGDVVGFLLRYSGEPQGMPLKGEISTDGSNISVISSLILRRFGGQSQLEKDLGRKIKTNEI